MEKSEPETKPPDRDIGHNIDDNMKGRNLLYDTPVNIDRDNNVNNKPIDESLGLDPSVIIKAREGDSFAQLDVAKSYYTATNMNNNCEKAFLWFKLAANQRNGEAQFLLGNLYALGEGTKKDEYTAYKWYVKSAIQGYPKALIRLQDIYHLEKSVQCRGLISNQEKVWNQSDFKRENNIRELFEFREQMLSTMLTKIKKFFEELIQDCRKQNTEEAYLILGFLYQHGYGIRKIRARAIKHYLLAAKKGNIDAQYNLGYIYHHNTNIKWNYLKSVKFYTEAAEKGQLYAQTGLAYLYLKGLHVDMDYSKARFWYAKAAENRNVEALISLARMFRQGQGVTQDNAKAMEWYLRAAKEGSTVAHNCIESLCTSKGLNIIDGNKNGDEKTPAIFTKRGLCSKLKADFSCLKHSDDQKSLEKVVKHALFGDAHAMFSVGKKYCDGGDFNQDQDTGFQWMLRSAKAGLTSSQYAVATMYKEGDCIVQNYHKASIWYMRAAKKGDNAARSGLGLMYYYGLGVRKDHLEASKWFTFAAEKNHKEAQCYLGKIKLNGEGLRQDALGGMKWLTKSIKQKNPEAIHNLASMYDIGIEVQKDWDRAISLYKIAAQMGCVDSQICLGNSLSKKNLPYYDPRTALNYYEMAANQNNPFAYYRMAVLLLDGKGVDQNFTRAYTLFKKARELGNEGAASLFNIPIDYHRSGDINYFQVFRMFTTVCLDNIDALQLNLASLYRDTFSFTYDGVLFRHASNYKISKEWCYVAVKNGAPEAHYLMGLLCEEDKQTEYDIMKSIEYYYFASENNNPRACYKLASRLLDGSRDSTPDSNILIIIFELLKRASDMGRPEATDILTMSDQSVKEYGEETIIKMLEEGAVLGGTITQYTLGLYHFNNNQQGGSFSEAIKWFTMASEGGYADAFYKLGQIYENSDKETQNSDKAIELYHIAALKGNEDALYRIARIYHSGHGIPKSYLEAFSYYSKAAYQGSILAQVVVSVEHISIWEDEKNSKNIISKESLFQYDEYFSMWESVAEQGDPNMQYKLGLVHEQNKTDVDLSMAHAWYIRSAEHSHKDALYRLGQIYSKGLGVEIDYTLSINYYEKSAHAENVDALYQLGTIYESGLGVEIDSEKAISYYNRAAEKGNGASQFKLGMLYEEGHILQQNILESVRYHTKAALQGNEEAYGHLLLLDYNKSADAYLLNNRFKLFYSLSKPRIEDTRNKAFLGDIHYELGLLYYNNTGTRFDFEKAWKHFKMASLIYMELRTFSNAFEFTVIKYQKHSDFHKDDYLRKLEMWEAISVIKKKNDKEAKFTEEELLAKEEKYELGLMYYHGVYANSPGDGTDKVDTIIRPDYFKAQKYFEAAIPQQVKGNLNSYNGDRNDEAAIAKHKADQYYMHSSYHLGMINCADMAFNDNDGVKTLYYLNFAVQGNHPNAQELVDTIMNGQDDKTMLYKTIFDYLTSNTDSDDSKANHYIGWMHFKGYGTEANYIKAFDYFTISADHKCPDSQFQLGLMYLKGRGVGNDQVKAIQLLKNAASQKQIDANHTLGMIYIHEGNFYTIKSDYREALRYFTVAAIQGHSESQYKAGKIHRDIFGTQQGIEEGNEWIIKAAKQGHPEANLCLAFLYHNGQGIKKDPIKSRMYLEEAARLGHPGALFELGVIYEQGDGTTKGDEKMIQYFQQAADKKHAKACYNLGMLHLNGRGTEKDYEKAFGYFKLSAEQGNLESQLALGLCYELGVYVKKDLAEAFAWYLKSAHQGEVSACFNLGRLYFAGQGVWQDLKIAIEYFTKSATQGHASSQLRLGNYYLSGHGLKKDLNKAVDWFSKAHLQGHLYAKYKLRTIYLTDTGIEVGYETRLCHYKSLAAAADGYLQFHFGNRYFNGDGVEKDISEAIEWYKKAAKQGHSLSNYKLGQIYSVGEDVEKDAVEAIRWYSKAADRGHVQANYNLGQIYFFGDGAEKDLKKAHHYYKIAADKGHTGAQFQLSNC